MKFETTSAHQTTLLASLISSVRKGDCPEGVEVDLSEYLSENELDLARHPSCSYLSDYPCVLYFEKVPTQA